MDISPLVLPPRPLPAAPAPGREAEMRRAAADFETVFLAEMLGHAGLGKSREAFGGGAGEDAFASLLTREQARLMVEAGGIGVAAQVYRALAGAGGPR